MTTVLVVDDRAANREVARAALDEGGYHVIEAADGRQALRLAVSRHPDIVLTDMLMPGMDGYQFAQELRDNPETAGIPLLFYTANYRRDEVGPLAATIGVSRIIEKSASPWELLDAIEEALRESPEAARRSPGTPTEPETRSARHIGVLNAKLLERTGALDESEARFAAMADASPVGIIITDKDGRATYVNPGARQIVGRADDDLLGDGWQRILGVGLPDLPVASEDRPETDDHRRSCRLAHPDRRDRRLTLLSRAIVDADGSVTGWIVTIDDITAVIEAEERRRNDDLERAAEARRQAAARFDSMARMAGGVAHDFNNLLNIILSSGDFIDESINEAGGVLTHDRVQEICQDVGRIRQAGRRAAELTHQLLTLGGRDVTKPAVADLNTVVREAVGMLTVPTDRAITVDVDLAADLDAVKGDAEQLRQALMSLATNAVEAMPTGGRLGIVTENGTGTAGTENVVHLCISDTGHGMPTEILDQAIEPFFTTKPKGAGPGLGLSTSYGIVRQSGGRLVLESEPGHGTTVHLYLPTTRRAAPPASPTAGPTGPSGRTILIAEDEDGLRDVIVRMLRRAGFNVLAASDGCEATAIADSHDGPIHAVLTDVVMPMMNGRELAAGLAVSRPDTPILFMSGYAESLMNEQGLIEVDAKVLSKPFNNDELLAALGTTLAPTG